MNSISSFPPAPHPVRPKLPNLSPETRDRLIGWALRQPGSMPWLLQRTAKYWEVHPGAGDDHHQRLDATAALDLLRHRIDRSDDRAAVEHLVSDLG